jgi:hypothetical protein
MTRAAFRAKEIILRAGLRLLGATWRVRESIPPDCLGVVAGAEHGVVAFWHGKMFPVWYRFRSLGHAALISASRDGELLARYLERSLGYRDVIRGSTSKGGSRALAEMVGALADRSLLVTPDGPRGPAREAKPGALIAAARAARPLVLVGWTCRRSVKLGSWDGMEIPYPFSQVDFRYCKFQISINENIEQISSTSDLPISPSFPGTGAFGSGDDVRNAAMNAARPGSAPAIEPGGDASGDRPSRSGAWIDEHTISRFNAALNVVTDGPEQPTDGGAR